MIKVFATALILTSFSTAVLGQQLVTTNGLNKLDTSFKATVNYFNRFSRFDTLKLPIVYSAKQYKVVLTDSAWHLNKRQVWLENPFSAEKADRYPLSYSVVYQSRLVSLFAPGYFTCFKTDDWQRDLLLEKQLNTKRFDRHWLIEGQLIGLIGTKYWQFTPQNGWKSYRGEIPFKKRPKMYEDTDYLVYNECNGEFGGRVFFFDKQTKKTYTTQSVCTVWIRHTKLGYEVLSNLGHMMGSASKQLIPDPRSLPLWENGQTNKVNTENPSYKPIDLFGYSGVQLFGGFERQGKVAYVLYLAERTCLATWANNTFTIVDPLFDNELYTHNPVTTAYTDVDLINLDYFSLGGEREVMCLLLKNSQLTLLFWH